MNEILKCDDSVESYLDDCCLTTFNDEKTTTNKLNISTCFKLQHFTEGRLDFQPPFSISKQCPSGDVFFQICVFETFLSQHTHLAPHPRPVSGWKYS